MDRRLNTFRMEDKKKKATQDLLNLLGKLGQDIESNIFSNNPPDDTKFCYDASNKKLFIIPEENELES